MATLTQTFARNTRRSVTEAAEKFANDCENKGYSIMEVSAKDLGHEWEATVTYFVEVAVATVADITSEAAEMFELNRRTAKSTQVFLTVAQATKLRAMCQSAGITRNKAREYKPAYRSYDNEGYFAYTFPCPKEGYSFLLTDAIGNGASSEIGGILYGTDYYGQSDIQPLND